MAIVELAAVSKIYSKKGQVDTRALNGVDLQISEGEFVVLSGPSGSGKTTLLNMIGGLDVPTSGDVSVSGKQLGEMSNHELTLFRRNTVGFIFQAYNLIPVLTAAENIGYVLQLQHILKSDIRERITDVAEQLGIGQLLDKKPPEMSGGQQQRVAVARALVSHPDIILADEPTANLDSENGELLVNMMKQINENQGTTFVFSSHDPMVIDHAGRNLTLKDGRIMSDGR